MSFTYKVVENGCYIVNRLTGNFIKRYMYQGFAKVDDRDELPRYMYRKFAVQRVEHKGFPVFVIRSRNIKKRGRQGILFLAGGGGLSRPMSIHFDTVTRLIQETGATVYFAYYPLAPKENVRGALAWLEDVYQAIQRRYLPRNIVFVGDSAGANLALSLSYRVSKKPAKVIAISPAPGLTNGRDREIRKAMETTDPLLNVEMNDLIAERWSKDVPLDDPDINPEGIDYSNFSDILMFYGSHELFYPHVKRLVQRIREDGTALETVERPMCHDWALCSFFPEGQMAIKKMRDFILSE